jgi:tartrate/fumarate subfamily iron-sulfur-dependent hydro-lyase beta chain
VKNLSLPLSPDEARHLRLGEQVTVTGSVFTGRSRFHIRAVEDNLFPPLDFAKVNGFFHVGPVMRETGAGWEVVSCEPTSSIRFERYGPDVVRKFNLRTLIGKTTMGPATAEALREVGGVYLSKIGVSGNLLRKQVKRVREVHFLEELGKTEATWVFDVEAFGPFFVAIDAEGNNYFKDLDEEVRSRLPDIETSLGIPAGYAFTDVDAG